MAKEIPLTKGKVAIVDDADFEWLSQWKWYSNAYGYAVRDALNRNGVRRHQYMHRIVLQPPDEHNIGPTGHPYPKYLVDHIDGDKRNNQRSNLRICTKSNNNHNRRPNSTVRQTSKYKGVSLRPSYEPRPWRARIGFNSKQIHVGYYATEIEAALAYNEAALKLHGEFARLNVITDLSLPDH